MSETWFIRDFNFPGEEYWQVTCFTEDAPKDGEKRLVLWDDSENQLPEGTWYEGSNTRDAANDEEKHSSVLSNDKEGNQVAEHTYVTRDPDFPEEGPWQVTGFDL